MVEGLYRLYIGSIWCLFRVSLGLTWGLCEGFCLGFIEGLFGVSMGCLHGVYMVLI